jgi:hypothetical protein
MNDKAKTGIPGKWTDDEIDLLIEVLEKSNGANFNEVYDKERKKYGFPARSKTAIRKKRTKLKRRAYPITDNFTMASLADYLGLPRHAPWQWQRHGLKTKKVGRFKIITRKNLRLFAHEHPFCFKRVEIDILEDIFDDELIEKIQQSHRAYAPVQVKWNPPDGKSQVFSSLRKAAKETHYAIGTVGWHIKNNTGLFEKI